MDAPKKFVGIYLLAIIANAAVFTILFLLIPSLRNTLVNEDQIIESLTAFFFFLTFILGMWFLFKIEHRWSRVIYAFIPIVGLIGFLDELSFGLRILGASKPFSIAGKKMDSVHDLIDVAWIIGNDLVEQLDSTTFLLIAFTIFVILVIIAGVIFHYLRRIENFDSWLRYNVPMFIFIAGFFCAFLLAELIDLSIIEGKGVIYDLVEEVSEETMAISMFFCTLHIRRIASMLPKVKNDEQNFA